MVPALRHRENIIQVNIQIPDKRIMARSQSQPSVGWIDLLVFIIIPKGYIKIKI
jgi:hypothetical protein